MWRKAAACDWWQGVGRPSRPFYYHEKIAIKIINKQTNERTDGRTDKQRHPVTFCGWRPPFSRALGLDVEPFVHGRPFALREDPLICIPTRVPTSRFGASARNSRALSLDGEQHSSLSASVSSNGDSQLGASKKRDERWILSFIQLGGRGSQLEEADATPKRERERDLKNKTRPERLELELELETSEPEAATPKAALTPEDEPSHLVPSFGAGAWFT